ncbi:hypothetical protein GUF79_17380, partial [Xanthomonas citri pv. citri]|nr:hypothetical protein [Xanthomonas citri pv. citri]
FGLIVVMFVVIFRVVSGLMFCLKKIFVWVLVLLLCYFILVIYNIVGFIDGYNILFYNLVVCDVLLLVVLVLLVVVVLVFVVFVVVLVFYWCVFGDVVVCCVVG